jgi:hypothetical protein
MLLWDLLFIEGSVILLKAVIVIIDELSPILFSCQDFSTLDDMQMTFF